MSYDDLDLDLAALGTPRDALPLAHGGDILARAAAITPVVVGLSGWKLAASLLAASLLGGVGGAAAWQGLSDSPEPVVLTEVVERIVEVPVELPVEVPVEVFAPVEVPVVQHVAAICEHPEPALAAAEEPQLEEPIEMGPEDFDTGWLDELPSPQRKASAVEMPSALELEEPQLARSLEHQLRLRVGTQLSRAPERPLGTEAAVEWVGTAQPRRVGTPWVAAGAELSTGAGGFEAGVPLSAGLGWSGQRMGVEAGWVVTGSGLRSVLPEEPERPGQRAIERASWGPGLSTGPTLALRLGDGGRVRLGASGEIARDPQGEPLLRGGLSLGMQTDILRER